MSVVLGFCNLDRFVDTEQKEFDRNKYESILLDMKKELVHRKPDFDDVIKNNIALCGKEINGYCISFSGQIYNENELEQGSTYEEVIANIISHNGIEGINKINGVFAGVCYDIKNNKLYLFRDHLGMAPLFYTIIDNILVFSSEIRGFYKFPNFKPVLGREGLSRILSIGPAVEEGNGILEGVHSVIGGHIEVFDKEGKKSFPYWQLEAKEHEHSFEETAQNVMYLLQDAVKKQMKTNNLNKLCSYLSGGIDSSIVTALTANELKKTGRRLSTFSFDFTGNDTFFKANDFQPERDKPYVEKVVKLFDTDHCYMECDTNALSGYLSRALEARGLPGMGDIDSSLMFFCDAVRQTHEIALTGECADEIFAGYPWFHKKELYEKDLFPWSSDMETRKLFLSEEFLKSVDLDGLAKACYEKTIKQTPYLEGESEEDRRKREISFLTIKWFMPTLVDRTERIGALSGISGRMPFADKRLVEYLWNVPYKIKTKDGVVKSLLRESAKGLLPDELLYRRKSPFPKTYNPNYEEVLCFRLNEIINDPNSPINQFTDKDKIKQFLSSPSDYGKPWFGQLMATPQKIAYFIQINTWIERNNISVIL